ncbi:MAG: sulfatase-like hydrolase/transferase [Saprospiraceae bacterium]|nr:sulfatase-like hydrolase/transferase [Saprospiraceae bacterium]
MTLDPIKIFYIPVVIAALISYAYLPREQATNRTTDRPNILVIMPDDLGWSDVGYQGSSIKTPNIDNLAKSGIRLTQQYVMPTCTPTRVSLMTGLYPSRYGVTAPAYGQVIDLGDPTLASILTANGYATSIVGKWHMGSPPYTPLKYGFQSSYGYFDGQIDPYTHEYKTGRKSWHRDDVLFEETGHATDLITKEAIRIIEMQRNRPFFLYVAYSTPHYPLEEPEKWTQMYAEISMSSSRKLFAASVTHMDSGIGEIIDALDRSGHRQNTLVLFISDNGGQLDWHNATHYHGKYADKPHQVLGNNFPLRGWKTDLYEGGIRVPAILNWPGHLEVGVIDVPIHIADWLPTLCYLAGSDQAVKKLDRDGQNIWPFIAGMTTDYTGHTMYWNTGRQHAIREGPWKLLLNSQSKQVELYNLTNDFRETQDLSNTEPQKREHLLKVLEAFQKKDR